MNPCPEYAALLDLYVDGELTAEEMDQVARHVADCPGCAAYVDDILAIRAAFPDAEDTPVPEDFSRRVMEAVAAHPRTAPKKRKRWLQAALPLAACLAVAILLQNGTLQRLIPAGAGSTSDAAPSAGAAMTESNAAEGWDGAADTADSGTAEEAPLPRLSGGTDGAVQEDAAPAETPEAAEAPKETEAENGTITQQDAVAPQLFATTAATSPDLTLTVQEAGTLLEGYVLVSETEDQLLYQLTAPEYAGLLEALDDLGVDWTGPAPETAETFLVAVTP